MSLSPYVSPGGDAESDLESQSEVETLGVVVGVCCLDSKVKTSSMKQLLESLDKYPELHVVVFGQECIFTLPVEEWPCCDCLISFFKEAPLIERVEKYLKLHPEIFCVNDLRNQTTLLDRRLVYTALKRNNVPSTPHAFMNRNSKPAGLTRTDSSRSIRTQLSCVEGPVEEEEDTPLLEYDDYIVVGGKRFEKPFVEKPVDSEDHNVRLYFHSSQGGGCVELFRKSEDKCHERLETSDIRTEGSYIYEDFISTDNCEDIKVYTVGLNNIYAERRASPWEDENVKRDASGKQLREAVVLTEYEKELAAKVVQAFNQRVCGFDILRQNGKSYVCDVNGWSLVKGNPEYIANAAQVLFEMFQSAVRSKGLNPLQDTPENARQLLGVAAVCRHADRTPKQKLKLKKVTNPQILEFLVDKPNCEIVFKSTNSKGQQGLAALLGIMQGTQSLKDSGFNSDDVIKIASFKSVLEKQYEGLKVQLKPTKVDKEMTPNRALECMVVCKWGGCLTPEGYAQARHLGTLYREVAIRNRGYDATEDLKKRVLRVCCNIERRVMQTALAFAGAFTNDEWTEDDLTIRSDLLGDSDPAKELMEKSKEKINKIMNSASSRPFLHIPGTKQLRKPRMSMEEALRLMKTLSSNLPKKAPLYGGEKADMMRARWSTLIKDFYDEKKSKFDTTKIPDLFDYMTYDAMYNQEYIRNDWLSLPLLPLFRVAEAMSAFVAHSEYGLDPETKLKTGALIAGPLLNTLFSDLIEMSEGKGPSTRLYFSSESHLHSLRNLLLHSKVTHFHQLNEPVPLHYLTHIVLKIYQWTHPSKSDNPFHIEVHFSPGVDVNPFGVKKGHHIERIKPLILINQSLTLAELALTCNVAQTIQNADTNNKSDASEDSDS